MKRILLVGALCVGLVSCALSQTSKQIPLRTLIVSGGPSLAQNEYAIESNARFVERLTEGAKWRRVHFANGKQNSRTIGAVKSDSQRREREILSWLMEWDDGGVSYELRAPNLKQINGASQRASVLQSLKFLTSSVQKGERGLVYFTGHGSTGEKPKFFGLGGGEDTNNTTYALWGGGDLSVQEFAPALQKWPADVPLALVMVQCHSGGFANILWEGGDPKNPVWNRDFAGFFASTGARPSSGCTTEVDETDYQDFTTHFFAALSGQTRDGKVGPKVDFDNSGQISMNEAFAYALVHDRSIDVPVSTSDAFLRRALNEETEFALSKPGTKTSYSQILQDATPYQRAALNGLSRELKLSGENRVSAAVPAWRRSKRQLQSDEYGTLGVDEERVWRVFERLQKELFKRFPDLESDDDAKFARAENAALKWLSAQKAQVAFLSKSYNAWTRAAENLSAREAMFERFLRLAHTVSLQKRLQASGTDEQKRVFARLRTSENRNPLR